MSEGLDQKSTDAQRPDAMFNDPPFGRVDAAPRKLASSRHEITSETIDFHSAAVQLRLERHGSSPCTLNKSRRGIQGCRESFGDIEGRYIRSQLPTTSPLPTGSPLPTTSQMMAPSRLNAAISSQLIPISSNTSSVWAPTSGAGLNFGTSSSNWHGTPTRSYATPSGDSTGAR